MFRSLQAKDFVLRTANNMNLANGQTRIATVFYSGQFSNGITTGNNGHFTASPTQLSSALRAAKYLGGLSATGE